MDGLAFTPSEIISVLTLLGVVLGNYWTYRNKSHALRNELAIAQANLQIAMLHDCLDSTRAEQAQMHAENKPVIQATMETVADIRRDQIAPDPPPPAAP